jgi:hypothetical protein
LKHLTNCLNKNFCDYCGVEIDEFEKEYHVLGACPETLFNCENCEEMF